MPDQPTPPIPTCPDCGGLLHTMRTERLTSAEVASEQFGQETTVIRQCLLCGYTESWPLDQAPGEAPALA
jgi:RNase P subunit RPR2